MKALIVNANTNSEWDQVSFVVIRLTPEHIAFLEKARMDAAILEKKHGTQFMSIKFSSGDEDWFIDETQLPEEMQPMEDELIVVDIEESFLEKLVRPEQDIRYGNVKITSTCVQYIAYGKHTDEEFWTGDINIKKLTKLYHDNKTTTVE